MNVDTFGWIKNILTIINKLMDANNFIILRKIASYYFEK